MFMHQMDFYSCLNLTLHRIIKRRMSQEEWTENDTMDMLDMMESALTRVKRGLSRKLGRFGNKKGETVASDASVESLDTLETYVTSAQTNTINVVEEINKGISIKNIICSKTPKWPTNTPNIPFLYDLKGIFLFFHSDF